MIYTLRHWQLWKLLQAGLAGQTSGLLLRQLELHHEYVVLYHKHAYTPMPLVILSRELLEMESAARAKG